MVYKTKVAACFGAWYATTRNFALCVYIAELLNFQQYFATELDTCTKLWAITKELLVSMYLRLCFQILNKQLGNLTLHFDAVL
jgi:hypothetical protein